MQARGLLGLALLLLGADRNRLRHRLTSVGLVLWLAAPAATFLLLAPQAGAPSSPAASTQLVAAAPFTAAVTETAAKGRRDRRP